MIFYLKSLNSLFSFFKKMCFVEDQLIYNIVLISDVQQSDSYIYILFHYDLLSDSEYSSHTVGPC